MTQSNSPLQELKRKRPKTHWIWYIGAITASLVVGVSITFAMQQTKQAVGSKETTKTTVFAINNSSSITQVKWTTKQPSKQIKANPVPAAESKAPVYSVVATNTNHTSVTVPEKKIKQKTKQETEQKKPITTLTKKPSKPHYQSKPSQKNKETKPSPPKETPPAEHPDPVVSKPEQPNKPPHHKGPIIRIVDRVTNTVHYLLTGNTKD